jgi:hypothetical protein
LGNLKGRALGKPRCRWEDNIRMNLKEIWWEVVDWVPLAIGNNGGLL